MRENGKWPDYSGWYAAPAPADGPAARLVLIAEVDRGEYFGEVTK